MKMMKRLAGAATAIALVATPTLAAAATPAASLSVAKAARAAAPAAKGSKLAEGGTATFVNIGILAALVVGVLIATKSDDDSDSN